MAKFYRSEDRTVLFELFGAGTSVENLKNLKANTTDAAVEKHVCLLYTSFLWLAHIIFWRIPFSFQQKSLICY